MNPLTSFSSVRWLPWFPWLPWPSLPGSLVPLPLTIRFWAPFPPTTPTLSAHRISFKIFKSCVLFAACKGPSEASLIASVLGRRSVAQFARRPCHRTDGIVLVESRGVPARSTHNGPILPFCTRKEDSSIVVWPAAPTTLPLNLLIF